MQDGLDFRADLGFLLQRKGQILGRFDPAPRLSELSNHRTEWRIPGQNRGDKT